MKLYNLDNSPFATRVRMQIRHKGLDVEIGVPPIALRTVEFKQAYPLGKLPVLDLLDGNTIGESTVIMNYLEDIFPQSAMRPTSPLAKAQDEMLIRYTDNHLAVALSPLFQEFFVALQSGAETLPNDTRFDLLEVELNKLDGLLKALPDFRHRGLQLGDLCLVTNIYYVKELSRHFGGADPLSSKAKINDWQDWVQDFAAVEHEMSVMNDAHQALIASMASVA